MHLKEGGERERERGEVVSWSEMKREERVSGKGRCV